MSVHSLGTSLTPARTSDQPGPLAQAKIHLAAAHRLAVLHALEEGIDNHFTVAVPGHDDQFLILPFGLHWSEARASDMMVFNEAGHTLAGTGVVELSARCIHAPIHRITGARVVLHTHQTWAIALNMLQDNRLLPTSQPGVIVVIGNVAVEKRGRLASGQQAVVLQHVQCNGPGLVDRKSVV